MSGMVISGYDEVQEDRYSAKEDVSHLQPIHAALSAMNETEIPSTEDRLSPSRISSVPDAAAEVKKVAFPNLGLAIVEAAIAVEEFKIGQLKGHEREIKGYINTIDQLLALSGRISSLSDKDKAPLQGPLKEAFDALRELGIDLGVPENAKEISKEKLIDIKSSLIQSHIDKSRTKIQTTFTKIQTLIQHMNSIMESAKSINRTREREMQTYTRNQKPN